MRVLYAEDDRSIQQTLTMLLKHWDYEVLTASDGAEAWEILQRDDCPQLVLLDWEMPRYQGTELCSMVRKLEGKESLYILLLTARFESADIVAGLNAGADDYIRKPFERSELKARLNVGCRTINLRNQLAEKNDRIRASLEAAASVQRTFLPPETLRIEGYSLEWKYLPSEYLGGDLLHVSLQGDYVICSIVDASGHGVPSALLSVTVGNHIRQATTSGTDAELCHNPAAMMDAMSHYFKSLFRRTQQYFTMIYGVLNTKTGEFRFAQAGHPFPVTTSNGKLSETPVTPNIAMGALETTYEEHTLTLAPGDDVFLYTDGITETLRPSDSKYFGATGLIDAIESVSPEGSCLDTILERSLAWGECSTFEDDATILRIKRL